MPWSGQKPKTSPSPLSTVIRVCGLVPTGARLTIVPPTPMGDPPFATNQADLLSRAEHIATPYQ